jgi:hypothetical protein
MRKAMVLDTALVVAAVFRRHFPIYGLGYFLKRQGDNLAAMIPKKLCVGRYDFLLFWAYCLLINYEL